MSFDAPTIISALITSAIGFVYFSYGKKRADLPYIICGVALMAYSYFCDSWITVVLIGAALTAAPHIWRRGI